MTDDLFTVSESRIDELCRQTKDLIRAAPGPLRRVRVRAGDSVVEIEWSEPAAVSGGAQATVLPVAEAAYAGSSAEPTTGPSSESPDTEALVAIEAPLVGTFYRAPSPDARPFVEVGDVVEPGRQVAIVEAMKLMNPVAADRAGRVVEVLVSDGSPVEYGEALLLIAPA
ncbi:acetyl-CoA carboxylase biotin carboxyl carrier protein [Actinoallomurus sp. NPDC052274]|uniref:acetyl-CoA carboxylase biotin carboxyl carrier protein n=1 Tax=Actinoallomurus sp. NPDC052274 TaxID=3155420 RepID=UPI0034213D20